MKTEISVWLQTIFIVQEALIKKLKKKTGETAMLAVYRDKMTDRLYLYRYNVFQRQVHDANTFVNPRDLPPTSAATKHHSRRIYNQVKSFFLFLVHY